MDATTATPTSFIASLTMQVRAMDTYGMWDGKSDAEILEPFIITKEKAREIPIIGDPDPDILDRVQQFYATIGLTIEKRCGLMASPVMEITPEGFGRMVLTCGRLVVINKVLRDVHRFGFPSADALASAGEKLIADALGWIEKYREVAEA